FVEDRTNEPLRSCETHDKGDGSAEVVALHDRRARQQERRDELITPRGELRVVKQGACGGGLLARDEESGFQETTGSALRQLTDECGRPVRVARVEEQPRLARLDQVPQCWSVVELEVAVDLVDRDEALVGALQRPRELHFLERGEDPEGIGGISL